MSDCNTNLACVTNTCSGDIRLSIWPRSTGGTVVEWSFGKNFIVDDTTRYQLQFSHSSSNEGDNWIDVGPILTNQIFAIDYAIRDIGQIRHSYYRLVVYRGAEISVSQPFYSDMANFSRRQRLLFDEILRREQRRYTDPAAPASPGTLLKLRRHGIVCPECTDPDTNQRIKEHCSTCFGAGYKYGYYAPISCFFVDLGPSQIDTLINESVGMHTQGPIVMGRFLNIPQVDPGDIWISSTTDYRWQIGKINTLAKIDHLSIVCTASMARLEFNHPVYDYQQ